MPRFKPSSRSAAAVALLRMAWAILTNPERAWSIPVFLTEPQGLKMTYDEARHQIRTGDVIGVRGRKGPLAWLTRLVTWSPYTHVGIALWVGGGLYLAEINGGGNHLIPMSQIAHTGFDVVRCPAHPADVPYAIETQLHDHQGYGFGTLVTIAARRVFGVELAGDGAVCSSYAATILTLAGWGHSLPNAPAPDEVMEASGKVVLEVRL